MRSLRLVLLVTFATLLGALASARPAFASGLLAVRTVDGSPLPPTGRPISLVSHRVSASIDGPVASVEVTQRFRNTTDRRLEADYLFPLPEGAAVSGFAMTLGGRVVQGEVMDAGAARQIYERIVRRRRDPGLLECVGRGLYRARVFPIEPYASVDIRLSFHQVLPDDMGTLEFRYPLASERLHDEAVAEVAVTVDVRGDVPIRAVYSPSHPLAVVRKSETEVQASFEESGRRESHDFLLYVGRSREDVGFSLISEKPVGDDGTFLAVLAPSPRAPARVVPKDAVFVLDTSGSMRADGKIDQARRALAYGLSLLRPEDRFGIVAFSAAARAFRPRLLAASPENRDAAVAWLQSLDAAGGTNLAGGLETALGLAEQGRLAIAVLLSDGRPTVGPRDVDGLLAGVRAANRASARVFTFGVGFDLDVGLLDRIAETTGGARDYVEPRQEIEIATSRFFRKVVDPVMSDVRVSLGDDVYDVYPTKLPDLFSGGQVVLLGRYAKAGPRTITLRGNVGDEEVVHSYETTFSDQEKAPYLPRLWAQRKVAFLLDEIRLHGEDPELVDAVKGLATRFAIVTPYTAGLVTDDAELAGRIRTANPLFRADPTGEHGTHGQFRGPGDGVPPGLREPRDPAAPPPPGTPTPAAPLPPATPMPAVAPTTPTPAPVDASKRLRDAKDRTRASDDDGIRVAGGRTLVRRRGRWVDTEFRPEMKPTVVVAYSDAWLELVGRDAKLAAILALGERIDFLWAGRPYRVEPPPE